MHTYVYIFLCIYIFCFPFYVHICLYLFIHMHMHIYVYILIHMILSICFFQSKRPQAERKQLDSASAVGKCAFLDVDLHRHVLRRRLLVVVVDDNRLAPRWRFWRECWLWKSCGASSQLRASRGSLTCSRGLGACRSRRFGSLNQAGGLGAFCSSGWALGTFSSTICVGDTGLA